MDNTIKDDNRLMDGIYDSVHLDDNVYDRNSRFFETIKYIGNNTDRLSKGGNSKEIFEFFKEISSDNPQLISKTYSILEKNTFPWSEDFLYLAIDRDTDYNTNMNALKKYISVSLENQNIPADKLMDIFKSPYSKTVKIIEDASKIRPKEKEKISVDLENRLLFSALRERWDFMGTKAVALSGMVYFQTSDINWILEKQIDAYSNKIEKLKKISHDESEIEAYLQQIDMNSTALKFL